MQLYVWSPRSPIITVEVCILCGIFYTQISKWWLNKPSRKEILILRRQLTDFFGPFTVLVWSGWARLRPSPLYIQRLNNIYTSKNSFSSSSPSLTPPAVTFPIFQSCFQVSFFRTPANFTPTFAILAPRNPSAQFSYGLTQTPASEIAWDEVCSVTSCC